jgi:hypothetical protein
VSALEFLPGRLPREVRDGFGAVMIPGGRRAYGHHFVPVTDNFDEFTFIP